jgi:hypothetical protein
MGARQHEWRGQATRPVARCAEIEHLGGVTQEWVAPEADDPALDALEDGLAPARVLGLDVEPAESILRGAKGRVNGTREQAAREARIALTSLAQAAGLDPRGVRELIPDPARRRGVDGAIAEIALVMDMDTFEEQALALVRAHARADGLGPVRWLVALRDRRSRVPAPPADPRAHLLAWTARGELVRAGDQVRRAIDEALPSIPDVLRERYAAAGRGDLEARLGAGVERLVGETAPEASVPPANRAWRIVGWVQWLNLALLAFSLVSLIGSAAGVLPLWQIHLPFFAGVPAAPVMLVLCPLIALALALGLGINAAKMGRTWSSRIENEVRRGIRVVVEAEAFAPLAPIESARARLGEAWHRILA